MSAVWYSEIVGWFISIHEGLGQKSYMIFSYKDSLQKRLRSSLLILIYKAEFWKNILHGSVSRMILEQNIEMWKNVTEKKNPNQQPAKKAIPKQPEIK